MQDAKEEVRARLAIEDIVGEYVQLKRAGRNFKGLSPFTDEKTPSFTVSPEKGIWHDFSSGKGGDIFSFMMEVEGFDFRAALEHLARKAGVEIKQYDSTKAGEASKKRQRLLEANELAAKYYQQSLLRNKHAFDYVVKQRGLNKQTVQEFRIGYAPDQGDALVRALTKKGFSPKEIADAGLTNRFGGDLFRGRMMVPLMDASGQVIGFTARILKDDPDAPKYLNTPGTMIYDKSRHVFALSQAKTALIKASRVVLVEGNMDAVSAHQAGTHQVVAIAGTAFTEQHLKQLSSYVKEISLCLDADRAGVAAAQRAIAQVIEFNKRFDKRSEQLTMSAVSLPDGYKDPDELIAADADKWAEVIEKGRDITEWVISTLIAQYSSEQLATVKAQEQLLEVIAPMIIRFSSRTREDHYVKYLLKHAPFNSIAVEEQLAQLRQDGNSSPAVRLRQSKAQRTEVVVDEYRYQDDIFAVLMLAPSTRQLLSDFDLSLFQGEHRQTIAKYFQKHHDAYTTVPEELRSLETYVKMVELKAETRYADWSDSDLALEAARLLRHVIRDQTERTKTALLHKLRQAEANGDEKSAIDLRKQLHQLIKEAHRG